MAVTTNWTNATTSLNDSSVGTIAWANTNNVFTSNDSYAIAANVGGSVNTFITNAVKIGTFGFGLASSTIEGIQVDVERFITYVSGGGSFGTPKTKTQLIDADGNPIGNVKELQVGGSDDSYISFGGTSDLWGWTPGFWDINDADFGVRIWNEWTVSSGDIVFDFKTDHIRMKVTYTALDGHHPMPSFRPNY